MYIKKKCHHVNRRGVAIFNENATKYTGHDPLCCFYNNSFSYSHELIGTIPITVSTSFWIIYKELCLPEIMGLLMMTSWARFFLLSIKLWWTNVIYILFYIFILSNKIHRNTLSIDFVNIFVIPMSSVSTGITHWWWSLWTDIDKTKTSPAPKISGNMENIIIFQNK